MYSSNTSITPASYTNLESAVYSNFDQHVFTPKYHGMHNQQEFYQKNKLDKDNTKDNYNTEKQRENSDVVIVDNMIFDLFLKFSPVLRSLESKEVKDLYAEFIRDKGKILLKYLKQKGKKFIDLVGFARMKLNANAIAAVIRSDNKAILAVNNDFDEKVYDFSKHNNISIKEAILYIFAHETVHLADVHSEKLTEKTVGEFFETLEQDNPNFTKLKKVAFRRSDESTS